MVQRPDTLVIGGGIVGCATAYFLTRRDPAHRVVVVEPDPAHRTSATARSAGGVRQQFSCPENIALSQFTLEIIRNPQDWLGEDAEIVFREQGYLILAGESGRAILAENHAVQRAAGTDIVLIETAEALGARFPWLATDGLACGAFGQSGEGWVDPVNLMTLFRRAALRQGATFVEDRVTALDRTGDRIVSARLASGAAIAAASTVIAAGPWSGEVAADSQTGAVRPGSTGTPRGLPKTPKFGTAKTGVGRGDRRVHSGSGSNHREAAAVRGVLPRRWRN